jgi:hypothetical protein
MWLGASLCNASVNIFTITIEVSEVVIADGLEGSHYLALYDL